MANRQKNSDIEELRLFLEMWKSFHDVLDAALLKDDVSREEETQFLDVKTQIAKQQAVLSGKGVFGQGKLGEQIIGIVSQIVSLRDAKEISPTQIKRIKGEWHNVYLTLNSLLGHYEQFFEGKRVTGKKRPFVAFLILFMLIAVIVSVFWAITAFRP